jgi:hypothetical protein
MTLQIIGAGFGRTGTLSLKEALETLGFAPCYHMVTLFAQPERLRAWSEAADHKARGEPTDWMAVFDGFRATVDWPGCAYWRELVAAFPEAKVLLTVRDPDRWYDSAANTIYRMTAPETEAGRAAMADAFPAEIAAQLHATGAFVNELIWQGTFGGRFSDREHAIRIFNEHNAAVIAEAPPERLLVYEVKEGWAPLCRFLGVAVPEDLPFPHVNDSESFRQLQTDPEAARQRIAELRRE